MLGDRRGARQAAEQAVALAPDLDRTQTVLGFTDLVEIRIRRRRRRSSGRSRWIPPTRCRAWAWASPRSAAAT